MIITDCYLCGKPIESTQAATSDHVVPTALLGKRQPKVQGCDYAGRIRTHQTCNNHFSDENFFRQALHLAQLILNGRTHAALQHTTNRNITILPVTPNQISAFVERDYKHFNFIDVRSVSIEKLRTHDFYADKRKTNLLKEAMNTAMTVMAKSAAALLVKRKLQFVPRSWKIFASPFHALAFPDFVKRYGAIKPFDQYTWAAIQDINEDEWLVAYQHKELLILFLFVFHNSSVDLKKIFTVPGNEIHKYTGHSLNELLTNKWDAA